MSDRETVEFLSTVPVLGGRNEADLAALGRVMRRRIVPKDEILWHQGDPGRELLFVVDGAVSASLHVPGDRIVEIGRVGPREILGECALLDGEGHTMTARVTETATVLALGRVDFAALLVGQHPSVFRLKRHLASLCAARLRGQLRQLAASIGGDMAEVPTEDAATPFGDLEQTGPPDSKYVRRMTTFHDFDPLALWGFLTSGKYVRCPPRRTLLTEGTPSTAYYLTINGAVEKVLVRGNRRIRVGLAGPGMAFGYEGLIDDRPSPITAITRERSLLLVLPRDPFDQLFNGGNDVSRNFIDAIQRDLLATLRQALRPSARLAASV
jgi:CRP-like cAMP-binding protein